MPSLQNYSTFGLEASCLSISEFTDIPSFLSLYNADESVYVLGGGSNSIFTDNFEGKVLVNKIKGISHYDTEEHHFVRVGAGENWHDFVTLCMQNYWYGIENLALIPGSVGASPIQNIGAYGIEVNEFIESVEVVMLETGEQVLIANRDCEFGYRDSIFKHALANKVLITHVNFKLPKQYSLETSYGELAELTNATANQIYEKVIDIRKRKLPDPNQLGNAGSFFKNPIVSEAVFNFISANYENVPHYIVYDDSHQEAGIKIPAAWLIDKAGFKGKSLNKVRCHPAQPLVLTNTGGANGDDVVNMAKSIITTVEAQFKVRLEPEVRLVGNKGLISL